MSKSRKSDKLVENRLDMIVRMYHEDPEALLAELDAVSDLFQEFSRNFADEGDPRMALIMQLLLVPTAVVYLVLNELKVEERNVDETDSG